MTPALAAVERAAKRRTSATDALRQAVVNAVAAGEVITDIARAAGIDRVTVYRWTR